MACPFYYMRPDEIWSFSSGASATAAGTDTDYQASWAIDTRPGRPYRSNATTFSLQLQATCGEVGMVVVANHNLDLGKLITIFSTSFMVSTEARPDGIPLNPFILRTPANTTSLTIASTSSANAANPVVGEVIAGKYRTLTRGLKLEDAAFEHLMFAADPQSEFASIPPFDKGLAQRTLTGSQTVSSSEFDDLRGWYEAQHGWTKPSVIVPDANVNDAWIVTVKNFRYRKVDASLYDVHLEFQEYPRSRW